LIGGSKNNAGSGLQPESLFLSPIGDHYFFGSKKVAQKTAAYRKNSAALLLVPKGPLRGSLKIQNSPRKAGLKQLNFLRSLRKSRPNFFQWRGIARLRRALEVAFLLKNTFLLRQVNLYISFTNKNTFPKIYRLFFRLRVSSE